MKIKTIQDIDLTQYKIAFYSGDCTDVEDTLDAVMVLADAGKISPDLYGMPEAFIALIPKDKRLQDCGGDDWDDKPASCNASGFYRYPEGTIFLRGHLGQELTLEQK